VKDIQPKGECTITTISFKVTQDVDPDRIFETIPDSVAQFKKNHKGVAFGLE
jgi:hypothetical protein